jgi:hypothetical protein
MTFLSWATSTVVRCVWVVGLTCRNMSSRLSVVGPRPAAAGAKRPPRPPPPRLTRLRPLPCWRIGIHASAIVMLWIFCFENVLNVTGVVQCDMSVRARNACRMIQLNFLIVVW